MGSQYLEDAERNSPMAGGDRNVTEVFWGASAPFTVCAVAINQTNAWGSALEEHNAMRVSASPGNTGLERTR
jgi:hypothetical protein